MSTFASELADDLSSALSSGKYIAVAGDTSLASNVYGQYQGIRVNGLDVNGDGSPDAYHLITVNPTLIGSGRNERLDATLVHEMLHMLENDGTTLETDYARFGTTESDHTAVYDKAAAQILRLAGGAKLEISTDSNAKSIQGLDGTSGSDTLVANSSYGGSFMEGYGGDDTLVSGFASSVLDGGDGNDTYQIVGGTGRLAVFDSSGYDTIDFGSGVSAAQLLVRLDAGGIELGIKPDGWGNVTTADLSNVVVIPGINYPSNAIEAVSIGGQSFSMATLVDQANTAPSFTTDPEYIVPSTFAGGWIGNYGVFDADNDPLSTSLVSVSGYASGSYWWLQNGALYTGAGAPNFNTNSSVVLRVSDGLKSVDLEVEVKWTKYSSVPTDIVVPSDHESQATSGPDGFRSPDFTAPRHDDVGTAQWMSLL